MLVVLGAVEIFQDVHVSINTLTLHIYSAFFSSHIYSTLFAHLVLQLVSSVFTNKPYLNKLFA